MLTAIRNLIERLTGGPRVRISIESLGAIVGADGLLRDVDGFVFQDQRRSKHSDPNVAGMYACRGERIVCEGRKRHLIATFVKDARLGRAQGANELDFNGVIPEPNRGTLSEYCRCICGARWFAGGNFHFEDGWR